MKRIFLVTLASIFSNTFFLKGMEEKNNSKRLRHNFLEQRFKGESKSYLWALSYSPDAQRLAVGDNDRVKILDFEQRRITHELDCNDLVSSLNFCEDGVKLILTAGSLFGTNLQVWDGLTGEVMQVFGDYFNQSEVNTCSADGLFCLHAEPQSRPSLWHIEKKFA